MPRYNLMHDHWKEFGPPVYMSVAAFMGMSKPGRKKTSPSSPGNSPETGNLEDLAAMFSGSGGVIQ